MPGTYVKIQSVTVTASGGQSNIEFLDIPNIYDDLLVKISARSSRSAISDDMTVRLNGVTTGYSGRVLQGDGSIAQSFTNGSSSLFDYSLVVNGNTSTSSTFGNAEFYIPNYTGTTNKSVSFDSVFENNATTASDRMAAGLVTITSAVTSITIAAASGNLMQHSTAVLYGIKKS